MDEQLKGLKEDVDLTISPDAYFTEADRREIHSKIKAEKTVHTPQKRFNFLPTVWTVLAVSAFIIIGGGFVGKELGLFATGEKPPTETPQELVPPAIDPDDDTTISGEITTGMSSILFMDSFEEMVVWSGMKETATNDSEIMTYNMRTQEFGETIETDSNVLDVQINADWITWVEAGAGDAIGEWTIYGINRKTNAKTVIRDSKDVAGNSNSRVRIPRISISDETNRLAWAEPEEEEGEVMSIVLVELDTGALQFVGESSADETVVTKVTDQHVLWTKDYREFVVYSIEEEKVETKFYNKLLTFDPTLNDQYVVWLEANEVNDTSENRLVMSKIIGSKEVELWHGNIHSFAIGDDYVVWESDRSIYAYSWAYRERTELDKNGERPIISGNTVIWQQGDEGGEVAKLQVVTLPTPGFDEYKDKMVEEKALGDRHVALEEDLKALFASNNIVGTDLKHGLYGVYVDDEGTAVIDLVPFTNIIGVPSLQDRLNLLNAMTDIIFSHPDVKEIYYTFNLNRTDFFDWMDSEEQVYTRE